MRTKSEDPKPRKSRVLLLVGLNDTSVFVPGGTTWRFMGSYKWSYTYSYPTCNPLITTHEPPSTTNLGTSLIAIGSAASVL